MVKTLASALLYATAAVAVARGSASPVGKWSGKVVVNDSKMQQGTAEQMRKIKTMIASIKSTSLTLTLLADHTYMAKSTLPGAKDDTGTWSESKSVVILSSKKNPGSHQSFKMSADGKTLSLELPSYFGVTGRVVLTRSVKTK